MFGGREDPWELDRIHRVNACNISNDDGESSEDILGCKLSNQSKQLFREVEAIVSELGADFLTNTLGKFWGCDNNTCDDCLRFLEKRWDFHFEQLGHWVAGFAKAQYSGINIAKFLSLDLNTWNSAGLFCEDLHKYKARADYVKDIAEKSSVFMIQETHDDGDSASWHLEQLVHDRMCVFRSWISSSTGGLLTLMCKEYIASFDSVVGHDIVAGRAFAVVCESSICNVVFVNVHIHGQPNGEDSKILILRHVKNFLARYASYIVFIAGDWNCVEKLEDRTILSEGRDIGVACRVMKYWQDEFQGFCEHQQNQHTRFPINWDEGRSGSLISQT